MCTEIKRTEYRRNEQTKETQNMNEEYISIYTASNRKEESTTSLAFKNGILMQEWKISETRDIYFDEEKTDYSHTEHFREKVWREVPSFNQNQPTKK